MSAIAETIHWRLVADELPDADSTVLVLGPNTDPVWLGYYDGRDIDGDPVWFAVDGVEVRVTHWAHMPLGDMLRSADEETGSRG
jgi:hypothetical protein